MNSSFQLRKIAGKEYAIGLFWQMLSGRDRNEIATLGQKLQFDLYVDGSSEKLAQVGFCSRKDGARVGISSLALQCLLHFSRLRPKEAEGTSNFVAVLHFTGGDEWYLLVVNKGVIQPDSDCLLPLDQMVERLVGLAGSSVNWDFILGPADLQELELPGFLVLEGDGGFKRPLNGTRLRAIQSGVEIRRRVLIFGAVATLMTTLAGGSTYWWMRELEQRQSREEQARQAALAAATPPPPPWRTAPSPQAFMGACLAQFRPTLPGGWLLLEFSCDGKEAKQSWSRGTGDLAALMLTEGGAVVDQQNEKATQTTALGEIETGSGEEPGRFRPTVVELVSLLQQLELRSAFTPPKAVNVPGVPVKPVMRSLDFSVDVEEFDPRSFIALFPTGTRLANIEWKEGNWKAKGVIYAYDE